MKHLKSQKSEAEAMKAKLNSAAQAVMQADEQASSRLQACLAEERQQASTDRQELLSQITALVNKSGEAQDARWESKIHAVREDIATSKTAFQQADKEYADNMDTWSKKENSLVEEVLKSRDTLKSKMKSDWTVINEHNNSIQTTTKSVHEETIRIVDEQMKDIATQMQALDDFVSRARSQNEQRHESHLKSLQGLGSTVNQSYTSIGDHFVSTYDRVRDIGTDVSSRTSAIQASLPPLSTTIQQPLSELRSNINNAPLKEYEPTGETPQKTQYTYPTSLPRTESHEKLLIKHSLRQPPPSSPSKSLVYNDTPPTSISAPPSPIKAPLSAPASLREVDMNVALGSSVSRHSDPAILDAKPASDGEVVVDLSKSVGGGMGPPPLKRQNTTGGESRLPTKFGGKQGMLRGGGLGEKENREAHGAGRRLRSSQAG